MVKNSKIIPWLIWLISALYLSYEMFQLTSFSTMQDKFIAIYHLSGWQVGLLSSSYLYGCAIFIIPAGLLIDAYPVKPILVINILLNIIGIGLMASSSHYWLLVLGRALTGVGNGFSFLGCMRLITDWLEERAAVIARGLTYTVGMLGCLLSQAPYQWLMDKTGLTGAYMASEIGAFILMILTICVVKQPYKERHKLILTQVGYHLKSAIKSKQNILTGIYACMINLPLVLLGAFWGNKYLINNFSLSSLQASKITSLIFIGLMCGAPVIGWLANIIKQRRLLMSYGGVISSILVMLMFFFKLNINQTALIFFLLGFLSGLQVLAYYISAESCHKTVEETSLSIVTTCINLGGAILQVMFGLLIESVTANYVLFVLSIIFILSLIAVFYTRETNGKKLFV